MANGASDVKKRDYKKKMGMVQSEAAAPQTGASAPERQKIAEK